MSEWLPIETAPKDTWVLVCDAEQGEFAVWRSQKLTSIYVDDVCGVSGYEWEVDITPTHWQPLPLPPSA